MMLVYRRFFIIHRFFGVSNQSLTANHPPDRRGLDKKTVGIGGIVSLGPRYLFVCYCMVALNIAVVALTAPKRPVHAANQRDKTRNIGASAGIKDNSQRRHRRIQA
ncbi:hypothetical protein [Arenibacterium sp. CAU 1754]